MISSGNDPERSGGSAADAPRRPGRTVWLVRTPSRTHRVIYIMGLILLAAVLGYALLRHFAPGFAAAPGWPLPCSFYTALHFPCPGCGGTRALKVLADGDLLQSFLYHPLIPLGAAGAVIFLVSQTAGRISRGRLRMLTFNDAYIYAILAVLLLQWIIKLITGWTP